MPVTQAPECGPDAESGFSTAEDRIRGGMASERNSGVTESDSHDEALGRAWLYGLLGVIFDDVPTQDTLNRLSSGEAARLAEVARSLGVPASSAHMIREFPDAGLEALGVEYTSLFEAHERIYPYASCWTSEKPRLMRKPWAMARAAYERSGLGLAEERLARADHIGTELSFLSVLAQREAEVASSDAKGDAHAEFVNFLEVHVIIWMPEFCTAVMQDRRAIRYAAIAEALSAVLGAEISVLTESAPEPAEAPGGAG